MSSVCTLSKQNFFQGIVPAAVTVIVPTSQGQNVCVTTASLPNAHITVNVLTDRSVRRTKDVPVSVTQVSKFTKYITKE